MLCCGIHGSSKLTLTCGRGRKVRIWTILIRFRVSTALLMLEPDPAKRIALLKRFGEYINVALSQIPPGSRDGLRPDGTAWRHEGNYPGYSFPAFKNASQLVYMLQGTPFEVRKEGRAALKKRWFQHGFTATQRPQWGSRVVTHSIHQA